MAAGLMFLSQLVACGGGGQATPTPPAPGQVGQPIEFADVELTVNSVMRQPQIGEFFKPASGNVYLTVNVTIRNKRPYQIPYQPFHFTVKDSAGREYKVGVTAGTQPLQSSNLDATKDVTGNINFEVPATATGLVLVYRVPGANGTMTVQLGDISVMPLPTPTPLATATPVNTPVPPPLTPPVLPTLELGLPPILPTIGLGTP